MLLVAGTGSVARAVDPRGEMLTVGGWGALLCDEGGGYGIGLDGIRAVLRSADGLMEVAGISALGSLEVTYSPRRTDADAV